MGRKKKTDQPPTVEILPLPAKNRAVSKSFDLCEVERPLASGDYEKIQQAMVACNRQRADLVAEMEERMSLVKETRKKINSLADDIGRSLLTIESGRTAEERRCLVVKDMNAMLVTRMDPETGEVFNQEAIPECQRQRNLDFTPDPVDDCHACKHVICRLPVDDHSKDGGGCLNYADCHDCPNFKCGYTDYEEPGRCGFGKHLGEEEDANGLVADDYPDSRDYDGDCFFCFDRTCDCVVFDPGLCPQDNTGGKDDCFLCGHFKCGDPTNCTAGMKRDQVAAADQAGAGDDGEAEAG